MKKAVLIFVSAGTLCMQGAVFAADQCTAWSQQPDGSEWRLCTRESDGSRYCQERRGSTITTVSCS